MMKRQAETPNAEIPSKVFLLHFFANGIEIMAQTTMVMPTIIVAVCSSKASLASLNKVTVFPIRIGYAVA